MQVVKLNPVAERNNFRFTWNYLGIFDFDVIYERHEQEKNEEENSKERKRRAKRKHTKRILCVHRTLFAVFEIQQFSIIESSLN